MPLQKKTLIVAAIVIIAIVVILAYFLMPKAPAKILWASTQLCPTKERAFVERENCCRHSRRRQA